MSKTEANDTVAMILTEDMTRVIDVFRDMFQNFEADEQFLLADIAGHGSLNHLFSNVLARAEDEIVTAAVLIYKTCVSGKRRSFRFKPMGAALASSDEIALLILLSASQKGRYGIAGEAAIRLGCVESLTALRAAYEFSSWLTASGIEIGPIDPRLMQQGGDEFADRMIDTHLEKLRFDTPTSKFSEDYLRLVRG
ncbi:MAG: hypothetical protein K2P80_01540 [Beijerinckiaceae bacterium]|nr:hypothetical protein [Beijerinckiaceae bacterium]